MNTLSELNRRSSEILCELWSVSKNNDNDNDNGNSNDNDNKDVSLGVGIVSVEELLFSSSHRHEVVLLERLGSASTSGPFKNRERQQRVISFEVTTKWFMNSTKLTLT